MARKERGKQTTKNRKKRDKTRTKKNNIKQVTNESHEKQGWKEETGRMR